ncbi:MAG TPA: hypothetical protein VMD91_18980 [Candidatus Sulfotelmatobacter sp.]|nr:hypothetical protein [Candidatus Sulfotelmatobacter sp.]
MSPSFVLAAVLLAQAAGASPPPVGVTPTPAPNRPLGPSYSLLYRCSNGGAVTVGLTPHAASILYNGRASVFARSDNPDGSVLLVGSGMQWLLRGRSLTLTRGVGVHAVALERCVAVGPGH